MRASEVYNIKQLLLILAAVLCVMFVMTFTYKHIVIRYAIVAVILVIMIINKNKILGWLKILKIPDHIIGNHGGKSMNVVGYIQEKWNKKGF